MWGSLGQGVVSAGRGGAQGGQASMMLGNMGRRAGVGGLERGGRGILWVRDPPRVFLWTDLGRLPFRGVPVGGRVSLIRVALAEEGASCNPILGSEPRLPRSVRPSLCVLACECPGLLGSGLDRGLARPSVATFRQEVSEGSELSWGDRRDVGSCCPA